MKLLWLTLLLVLVTAGFTLAQAQQQLFEIAGLAVYGADPNRPHVAIQNLTDSLVRSGGARQCSERPSWASNQVLRQLLASKIVAAAKRLGADALIVRTADTRDACGAPIRPRDMAAGYTDIDTGQWTLSVGSYIPVTRKVVVEVTAVKWTGEAKAPSPSATSAPIPETPRYVVSRTNSPAPRWGNGPKGLAGVSFGRTAQGVAKQMKKSSTDFAHVMGDVYLGRLPFAGKDSRAAIFMFDKDGLVAVHILRISAADYDSVLATLVELFGEPHICVDGPPAVATQTHDDCAWKGKSTSVVLAADEQGDGKPITYELKAGNSSYLSGDLDRFRNARTR